MVKNLVERAIRRIDRLAESVASPFGEQGKLEVKPIDGDGDLIPFEDGVHGYLLELMGISSELGPAGTVLLSREACEAVASVNPYDVPWPPGDAGLKALAKGAFLEYAEESPDFEALVGEEWFREAEGRQDGAALCYRNGGWEGDHNRWEHILKPILMGSEPPAAVESEIYLGADLDHRAYRRGRRRLGAEGFNAWFAGEFAERIAENCFLYQWGVLPDSFTVARVAPEAEDGNYRVRFKVNRWLSESSRSVLHIYVKALYRCVLGELKRGAEAALRA